MGPTPTGQNSLPRLIGMVHLRALPGSPGFDGDMEAVLAAAVADAVTLESAGFDGLMVENYGDAPFFADRVPAVTVAAMARAVAAIREAVTRPLGINVLRNDALSAMSIAAASQADYIRVNVLAGMMFTDQGPIIGKAAEVTRLRAQLGANVAILADVFVKHAVPPSGVTLPQAAEELVGRGGADAVIVSGVATGKAPDPVHLKEARAAIGDAALYVGSGVNTQTAPSYLEVADGLIVGSAAKPNGDIDAPVDAALAAAIVAATQR